jgi:hypothetical protein
MQTDADVILRLVTANATTRFHCNNCWINGSVAARGACAAGGHG